MSCCPTKKETYSSSSLVENCIEFDFGTNQNTYVGSSQAYLALKPKLVKFRGYETYNAKEVKKDHKQGAKVIEETEDEEIPVPLVTHVFSTLHSDFPMLRRTSTISKFTNHLDSTPTSNTFPTTSREPSLRIREFCTTKGTTKKFFQAQLRKRLSLNIILQGE